MVLIALSTECTILVRTFNDDVDDAIFASLSCRFVKDFTAADIILSFPIEATEKRLGLEPYPHLRKYLDTIHARAAYKRAEERGGKLTLM